ncbi:ribosome-inactivating family protein [Streptomyces sp. UG1]|uniref:ribosome-inactivating family protein n=1 Tax=Streptomyces sp. UG1 TaxID=3417652 RepID=UPI003CEF8C44
MSTDLVAGPSPLSRHKRLTSSVIAAVLGALFLTLLGPLGNASKAYAADGNPTYQIGIGGSETAGQDAYERFLDAVADRAASGSSDVPRTTSEVAHTDPSSSSFFQVDVQAWGSDTFVRLNIRRSDMYIMGWWTGSNVYNYVGSRGTDRNGRPLPPPGSESGRWTTQGWLAADSTWQLPGAGEGYDSLQRAANTARTDITFSRENVNTAVWDLYNARDPRQMARAFLVMTQFVAEAARFRPIGRDIGMVMDGGELRLPRDFVEQENSWDALSRRFNDLLRNHAPGYVDPSPLWGYRSGQFGESVPFRILTAIMYADYVLHTSKGR